MVTSTSCGDTKLAGPIATPSMVTVVDAVNPLPYTGTTVPAGTTPIPAGIFSTERVPRTVTEPPATDTLESGEGAETATLRPAGVVKTGTETHTPGNPASWPIPPVADENCTSISGPVTVASPVASPL